MRSFNWKMSLAATVLSLTAAGLGNMALANGSPSLAGTEYGAPRNVSGATASTPRASIVEGRNVYVDERPPVQVEAYIRRSIEMDKRSSR